MTRVSSEQVQRIAELHDDGLSVRAIAREVGLSRSSTHRVLQALSQPAKPVPSADPPVPTWPPPVEESTSWRERQLSSRELVRVRDVRLWGRTVEVDAQGHVFCPCCLSLVNVDVLARPDNVHPVGLRRRRMLSLGDDDWVAEPEPRRLLW